MSGNTLSGLVMLAAVLVLATAWALLEHRRTERRRRQESAELRRVAARYERG